MSFGVQTSHLSGGFEPVQAGMEGEFTHTIFRGLQRPSYMGSKSSLILEIFPVRTSHEWSPYAYTV